MESVGSRWLSSGKRACLLLGPSEFESRSIDFLLIYAWKDEINKKRPELAEFSKSYGMQNQV